MLINHEVYSVLESGSEQVGFFAHGLTYSGHPVCAAVALECLKIYEDNDILGHIRRVGPRLQYGLRERYADHPMVGEVRGVGLMAATELVADKKTRARFPAPMNVANAVRAAALGERIIVRALGNNVMFSPPLVISDEETDFLLDRFGRALDTVWRSLSA